MYPRGGVGSTARPNETEVTSRYFTGMIGICTSMLRIKMTERDATSPTSDDELENLIGTQEDEDLNADSQGTTVDDDFSQQQPSPGSPSGSGSAEREKEGFIPKYVYLTLSTTSLPNRRRPGPRLMVITCLV